MGKQEIARYEQFLLFPQCFQKACFPGASKGVTVWKWVKRYCETRIFHRALIFVDFVGNAIHEIKFTTNVWSGSLICD